MRVVPSRGRLRRLEIDLPELPVFEAIATVDRDFPFEPQRNPRLRPDRDADRIGVHTRDKREASQLVGYPRARRHGRLAAREHAGRSVVDAVRPEPDRSFGRQALPDGALVEAVARGLDLGDPRHEVGILNDGAPREQQHLVRHASARQAGNQVSAVDEALNVGSHL